VKAPSELWTVARCLGDILDEVVFVGGMIRELLITELPWRVFFERLWGGEIVREGTEEKCSAAIRSTPNARSARRVPHWPRRTKEEAYRSG
jgi:hypothetical protein